MESKTTAAASPALRCEVLRLPDDLLSATLARTGPRAACLAAAVSPTFRAVADADAVWSRLLPRDLPALADGELPADDPLALPAKKQLFLRLSDPRCPVLLADGLTSMWLDRETGAKCYMLPARKLGIAWGDTPQYWRWIPIAVRRISEAAELRHVWWLEVRGEMDAKMLSRRTTYGAYMVFSLAQRRIGLHYLCQEASVSLGGGGSSGLTRRRRVCLDVGHDRADSTRPSSGADVPEDTLFPRVRGDGWMEVELGEFYSGDGEGDGYEDGGEVSMSLMETAVLKSGLVVLGIEIRPKE